MQTEFFLDSSLNVRIDVVGWIAGVVQYEVVVLEVIDQLVRCALIFRVVITGVEFVDSLVIVVIYEELV